VARFPYETQLRGEVSGKRHAIIKPTSVSTKVILIVFSATVAKLRTHGLRDRNRATPTAFKLTLEIIVHSQPYF
jgi:hypothetical protein